MQINLKYLSLSILIPISVMAGDHTGKLSNNLPDQKDELKNFTVIIPYSDSTDTSVTSNSPKTIIELPLTFSHARHLWFYGNERERDFARPTLYHFIQDERSGDYFGESRAFLLAPHLFLSDNKKDVEIAANYLRTIYFDKSHKDYQNLVNLLKKDVFFKNKLNKVI